MKKIFILIFIFLIAPVTCFANLYKLPQKYKQEINLAIKKQIPISKNEIKKIYKEIEQENNLYIKRVMIEQDIDSVKFNFYMNLVDITNKYQNIKNDIPPTDSYTLLEEIITPYLINNNIDTKQINSFLEYANKKQNQLEKKYYYYYYY